MIIHQERSQHQQECFNGCSKNLIYAATFIHLIHIAYLHNNIASFYNGNNKFLNGRSKIKYCRGFDMNEVTLIYRAIIQTHSQAKKTRRNKIHHSSSSCSQDMTSMVYRQWPIS